MNLCADWLDAWLPPLCLACGVPLVDFERERGLCAECAASYRAPRLRQRKLRGLGRVGSMWRYDECIARLIVQAKAQAASPCWPMLSRPWLAAAAASPEAAICAAPPSRKRPGGWNLASALAAALRQRTGWPAGPRLRKQRRPPQSGLDGMQRRSNLHGAMRVKGSAYVPARVLLVDDVLTTGATLREAARALRAAGVREVDAIVLAAVADRRGRSTPRMRA